MKIFKSVSVVIRQLKGIKGYSRDVFIGSMQLAFMIYIMAGVIYLIAPYTPDYFISIAYYQAALEKGPVVIALGTLLTFTVDICMRKMGYTDDNQPKNVPKKQNNDINSHDGDK